jgi:TatD DNase family protein
MSESLHLFDSHCHLDPNTWGDDLDQVIARARAAGVQEMTTIGSDDSVEYAQAAVQLAERESQIYATVGIHPHNAADCSDQVFETIAEMAAKSCVVGIGETGLDYHYDLSPREIQKTVFRRFIGLARDLDKALIIHCRNAFDDCITILEEEGARELRVIIHCFTGERAHAERLLEMGCDISIPGIVTFKKAGDIPEVAATVPIDRLLIETDCPYLAPVPRRGKKNEPSFLLYTAEKIAELREISLEALAAATTHNARRNYGLL